MWLRDRELRVKVNLKVRWEFRLLGLIWSMVKMSVLKKGYGLDSIVGLT